LAGGVWFLTLVCGRRLWRADLVKDFGDFLADRLEEFGDEFTRVLRVLRVRSETGDFMKKSHMRSNTPTRTGQKDSFLVYIY
jgi:hypothetical protein